MSAATVKLWDTAIGYVSMDHSERYARFEYAPEFVSFSIESAPLYMLLRKGRIYQFQDLHPRSFHGLPGVAADSLPDRYGSRLIDIWLAQTGRQPSQFNAVDRLCCIGTRGMGALEYEPSMGIEAARDRHLEVADLVELAAMAFADRQTLNAKLAPGAEKKALLDIVSVGTSAGGARAKAVVACNLQTKEVRSGQMDLPCGFEHWLIEFDGVAFSGDWDLADPSGFGLLEYSYYFDGKGLRHRYHGKLPIE